MKYVSPWNNGAGTLTFEYPLQKAGMFENGSVVTFTYRNSNIFYGWLFKSKQDKKTISCTCYDQLRYFTAKNSILREIEPLDGFVKKVCGTVQERVSLGQIDSTEVKLGKYLFDNKTHLDMLYQSIQDNLLLNGYLYTLRDNFGALELRDTLDLRLPLVIGDSSLATEYDYTKSIDDDTYNYIKVAKDDKEAATRNTYIAQDSANISKWGKLMLYEKVDANLNYSQLVDRANRLLALKNRETETTTVECIGDTRIFGGSGVEVKINDAGINSWAVVTNAAHEFKKDSHTMKLDLQFGRWY